MQETIKLPKYVIDILSLYGDLNIVVNNIIDMAMLGELGMEVEKLSNPCCDAPQSNYTFTIFNEDYCELKKSYGRTSSRLSLRRILLYFVDNELYAEAGWTIVKRPPEHCAVDIQKWGAIIDKLEELQSDVRVQCNEQIVNNIKNLISNAKETLKLCIQNKIYSLS